jgi:hypothetical protein
MPSWLYEHTEFGESPLPDGSAIRRPAVRIAAAAFDQNLLGVIDSGSPVSVAGSWLFEHLGIDLAVTKPIYEVPLTLGGRFGTIPVFSVELILQPPLDSMQQEPIHWTLQLGSRPNWSFPFAILFGQRGWFDQFPTTINATHTEVHLPG